MRFEIGPGGAIVAMAGLAGLSGAVFLFGMLTGYEIARQDQVAAARSTLYSGTISPEASQEAAVGSPTPFSHATASALSSPTAPSETVAGPPAAPSAGAESPVSVPPPGGVAVSQPTAVPPPVVRYRTARPSPPAAQPVAGEATPAAPRAETPAKAVAGPGVPSPATPAARSSGQAPQEKASEPRRPYSVQIEAAMDHASALRMVNKLRRMGYQAYLAETPIEGHTWYRVRVGHYATRAEAMAAERELHQRLHGGLKTE